MSLARYRHLVIDRPMSPPTSAEITAIEQEIGAKLPEDFKAFLAVANGGHMEYEIEVEHPAGKERISFCGLFATRPGNGWGTFLGELLAARKAFRLPAAVLPIARDGGSSLVFLDLTEEGQGRVVAFIHGLPAWTGLRQADAFVEVASNYSAYVEKLFISEDLARELIEDARKERDEERLVAIREWLDIGMPNWRERLGPDALTGV